MKTDCIELAYSLSAKDRVYTQNMLNHLSLSRENSALSWMASPRVALAADIFLGVMLVTWLIQFLPTLPTKPWAEILRPSDIPGYLFSLFIIWHLTRRSWQFAGRYWGREKAARAGREGVNWGAHRLSATSKALTIDRARSSTVYSWAAFSGLQTSKHMLLLMLTPKSAVAVPRSAFNSKADERTFCDFVEQQIART